MKQEEQEEEEMNEGRVWTRERMHGCAIKARDRARSLSGTEIDRRREKGRLPRPIHRWPLIYREAERKEHDLSVDASAG